MRLALQEQGLALGDELVPDVEVLGFHEAFDPWLGAVWLRVEGPGWWVAADEGYRALRGELRARYPDRPYTSDWASRGRFAGLVLGHPPGGVFAVAVLVVGATVACLGAVGGLVPGIVAAALWAWPLARARVSLTIGVEGVHIGPAWAPLIPWHEVQQVTIHPVARGVRLRVATGAGVSAISVPASTWPAARARLRRLGAVVPDEVSPALEDVYASARAAAVGAPWGVLAAVAVAGWVSPSPWEVWTYGALAAAFTGFVGGAVEARLSGWATGGIFWMTAAYAVLLLAGLVAAL